MNNKISHSGVIESITEGGVKVRILQTSACSACKVASHCNASESKEKIIDVMNVADMSTLKVGETVVVSTSRDVANRALLLGFGIPLSLLVGILMLVLWQTSNEAVAALSGLLALVPYYILLYIFRHRIQRDVAFTIET